jgi:hypothetical protein
MNKLFLILSLSFMLAGEMEVDGDLNVSGDINSPTIDALEGIKPERIYRYVGLDGETYGLIVPNNKCWVISGTMPRSSGEIHIKQNNETIGMLAYNTSQKVYASSFVMLSGDDFQIYFSKPGILNIYEYSISGSGTDQGMNYIIP